MIWKEKYWLIQSIEVINWQQKRIIFDSNINEEYPMKNTLIDNFEYARLSENILKNNNFIEFINLNNNKINIINIMFIKNISVNRKNKDFKIEMKWYLDSELVQQNIFYIISLEDYKQIEFFIIDTYSKFLWRWNIESNIWFIWNEEQLRENETPLQKIINDNINNNIKKDFFWCDFLSDSCVQYKIINNILWDINSSNDFFISEFYFLPSLDWNSIFETYWWKKQDLIKNKEVSYLSRDSYYVNNNLVDLLNSRFSKILSFLTEKSKRIVVFYWCDSKKKKRIKKKFWNFIKIKGSDNLIKSNYKWNTIIISSFFNEYSISENDISILKSIKN